MPNSSLASLSAALPTATIQSLADHFGTKESVVLSGIQSAIASVTTGLSQKTDDQGFVNRIVQLATATPENAVASTLSSGSLGNPNSPLLEEGKKFLMSIFGGKLSSLTDALGSKTGLKASAASTLLVIGGQSVLSFIGSKIRDGSLNAGSLPGFLEKESSGLLGLLPADFNSHMPVPANHRVDNPVVAQTVQRENRTSIFPWLLGLLVAAILLGLWWYQSHRQPVGTTEPVATAPMVPIVTSSTGVNLGSLSDVTLPDSTTLHIPKRGVENKLLAFINDSSQSPNKTSWFDFDRLLFNAGSASPESQSAEQLNNMAAILKAYPAVHLIIGGYTDNTGDAAQNLKLSQARANSVAEQLEKMGIVGNRLVAKGYGEDHPVADNAAAEGRALNRRISMLVTAK